MTFLGVQLVVYSVQLASKTDHFVGCFHGLSRVRGNRVIETYGAGDGNRTYRQFTKSRSISWPYTPRRPYLGIKNGDFAPKLRPNFPIAQTVWAMGAKPKSRLNLGAIGQSPRHEFDGQSDLC